jgi:hypothetical protein
MRYPIAGLASVILAKYLIYWQEWQGSNLRPPVLETGALPIELHSCREPGVAADSGAFQAQGMPGLQGRNGKRPVQARASAPDFLS